MYKIKNFWFAVNLPVNFQIDVLLLMKCLAIHQLSQPNLCFFAVFNYTKFIKNLPVA